MKSLQSIYLNSDTEDNSLYYSNDNGFDIHNQVRKKESQVNVLKLNIQSEGKCNQFDYFSRLIKRIPNVKELEISINVKLENGEMHPKSRVKEILDFVADTIIPQYEDKLEMITFSQIQIQEESEKDEEQTIKEYLLRLLKPLNQLKVLSFRQRITEVSNFYGFKQFLKLLKENSLNLPNLKHLDFEFNYIQDQINFKSFQLKEVMNNMLEIVKHLSQIKQLEELQIGISNLTFKQDFFEFLIQSIIQMKNLKKLGLDISGNKITVENSVKNIKQLQCLASQLESFIYIYSQSYKPKNIKEFSQVMKNFENLKSLQLEEFSFKKGNISEFFSFLSFMPKLEEIKFDLENVLLNSDDYCYFVKQVKQLENLTSIHLILPEENPNQLEEKPFLPENTLTNIIDMITQFKGQLLSLSLQFNSGISESKMFNNAICELEQLQNLNLSFAEISERIEMDSRKQNAQNIWNLKELEFLYDFGFRYRYKFIIEVLKLRILAKQNSQALQKLTIQEDFQNQFEIKQIFKEVIEATKFNNLKILRYISTAQTKLGDLLVQSNVNTLIQLELDHSLYLQNEILLELVKDCKLLTCLNIGLANPTSQFLKKLFFNLKFIQKLTLKFKIQFVVDPKVFLGTNYLTDFQTFFFDQKQNDKKISLLNERKVYILQNIIYSQIIQPLIIYQPQLSHLDVAID